MFVEPFSKNWIKEHLDTRFTISTRLMTELSDLCEKLNDVFGKEAPITQQAEMAYNWAYQEYNNILNIKREFEKETGNDRIS